MMNNVLLKHSYKNPFFLSIVTTMYNEEENIDMFVSKVITTVTKLTEHYEIVCVNDGSIDNTLERLIECHLKNPAIKIVNLSRNFGKEQALTAGLNCAQGDAVVPIDADLQDPPELIEEMVNRWKEGNDVVYAVREVRLGENWLKKMTAKLFYMIINAISEIPIPKNTGDFRLLDRRVVQALQQLPEEGRFMKGLFSWVGFRQTSVLYLRQPRYKGKTKWNYWKLWNFALEGVTSFSFLPLRIWSYIGVCISLLSFFSALFFVFQKIIIGIDVPGYATLMVIGLLLSGIILLGLGIQGEYMGRIFKEVKRRPLYLISDIWGIDLDLIKKQTYGSERTKNTTG